MPDTETPVPPAHETALAFEGLSVGYGDRTILKDIDMQVGRGEVVAVMGGSGSGKTTLLRAAVGQLAPQRGTVRALGRDLAGLADAELFKVRQQMGVLFQQGALFTDLDVFENVAFPLREHTRRPEAEILDIVLGKLQAVGLKAAAYLRTSEISGGMARRVALARAVVLDPELILYDEPFAGLDPISLGVTAQLIRHMADTLGCASVLITHDVQESFAIADRVYLLGRGSLVAAGTPAELSASTDPFVRQFLRGEPDGPVAFHYPETPAYQAWLDRQRRARP
ncbi:ABC transporter ATP-binding protein [Pigmentiphaga soli]|uniref:ABC transporter ATP-binding protein n=1 Tax=Pigmentiphaga soli TaxID=1007095 RepID=A0ABP8GIB6_9BURK